MDLLVDSIKVIVTVAFIILPWIGLYSSLKDVNTFLKHKMKQTATFILCTESIGCVLLGASMWKLVSHTLILPALSLMVVGAITGGVMKYHLTVWKNDSK